MPLNDHLNHTPDARGVDAISRIRRLIIQLDAAIEQLVPPGREKSLAMTKLEECRMWAVKGIVLMYPAQPLEFLQNYEQTQDPVTASIEREVQAKQNYEAGKGMAQPEPEAPGSSPTEPSEPTEDTTGEIEPAPLESETLDSEPGNETSGDASTLAETETLGSDSTSTASDDIPNAEEIPDLPEEEPTGTAFGVYTGRAGD